MTTEQTIWAYLLPRLGNPLGAAGLMGNLYAESALRPDDLEGAASRRLGMTDTEYTAAVDSGEYSYEAFCTDGAGYGLAQWTHKSRKAALYRFWKALHRVQGDKSIGDLDMQLDFLWEELQTYPDVLCALRNARTIREASDAVLHGYERPANQSEAVEEKRAGYGQEIYGRNAECGSAPKAFSSGEGGSRRLMDVALTDKEEETLMGKIRASALVADFRKMLTDKWGYIPSTSGALWTKALQEQKAAKDANVAKYGSQWIGHHVCDCSGAFVWAYKQHGLSIYQGSNRIARRYIDKLRPITEAKPGMAAFKAYKPGDKYYGLPAEYKQGGSYYNGDLLDYYHIGLVDSDPNIILNSANVQNGFRESAAAGWDAVGYLKAVDYEGGEEPMEGTKLIVTAENGKPVNLRSGPGTSYSRIAELPVGTIVDLITAGEWDFVRSGSKQGYMMSKYLAPCNAPAQEQPDPWDEEIMAYLQTAQTALDKAMELLNAKG